jgi:hypothetical protein
VTNQSLQRFLDTLPSKFTSTIRTLLKPNYPPEAMGNSYKANEIPSELARTEIGRRFLEHTGYETVKWGQYFEAYERFLANYRQGVVNPDGSRRQVRFLEIGVRAGGSLQVFQEYFGVNAKIVGIDIDERCGKLDVAPACIRIGDQSDENFLRSVVEELGGLDIVIDDGSHLPKDQMSSFRVLWPLLSNNGIYIVEDTHTSYWRRFGGGYQKPAGFIEFVKDSIDGMHSWYSRHRMTKRGRFAMTEVLAITVFDSLVVYEKTTGKRPVNLRFGQERIFR